MNLTWALAIMAFLASFFSLSMARTIQDASQVSSLEQNQYLSAAATQVTNWYVDDAVNIDSQTGQVSPPAINGEWPVTVLMSNRIICSNGVQAHKYALVLPGLGGIGTTMDINTGIVSISKNDLVQIIDGCTIEFNFLTNSEQKAQDLVAALENYFKSQSLEEGGGSTTKNFFAAPDCGGFGAIPCTTGSMADMLEAYLGVSATDCRDAYGNLMYFDNDSASVAGGPPYQARVGFNTPWGNTTWLMALQPN